MGNDLGAAPDHAAKEGVVSTTMGEDEELSEEPHPVLPGHAAFVIDGVLVSESGVGPVPRVTLTGPVMLADREGVFAHSFKCLVCRLEFVVQSWRRNRHRVGNTHCPECGACTPMNHWRATLSTERRMITDESRLGESLEIYDVVPLGDADLMDDTIWDR